MINIIIDIYFGPKLCLINLIQQLYDSTSLTDYLP